MSVLRNLSAVVWSDTRNILANYWSDYAIAQ